MKKRLGIQFLTVCLVLCAQLAGAAKQTNKPKDWHIWLGELRSEAVSQGVRPETFDRAFKGVKPSRRVNNLSKSQPEKRLTFNKYRRTRIDNYRIVIGAKKYKKHRAQLEKIGEEYGVDPCFITSFWGIETSYGSYMGKFPVIASLATLSYDGRRADFFRKELLIALQILDNGHVDLDRYKGEWAGASGHPQFLPSSWQKFAVDYNGDGHKDIWNNLDDVYASIANYLVQNGWQPGQPWAYEVQLPANFDQTQVKSKIERPVAEWKAQGIRMADGTEITDNGLMASIVTPYGGPAFLAFKNFRVIMRYNNSTFYAGSVGYLADNICKRIGRSVQ